jgi:lysyl-tRNA synthetase class I
MLLQVVRQPDPGRMLAFVQTVEKTGITRDEAREARSRSQRVKKARGFVYRYNPKSEAFSLTISFRKSRVSREEIEKILKEALHHVRDQ